MNKECSDAKGKERGFAYYHNPGPETFKMVTIGNLIDAAVRKWPNKPFIISHHEKITLTFSQAKEKAEKLAVGLLTLGLKSGDRLAFLGVNSVHYYLTLMAAAKAGIILALLNPAYQRQELDYALKKVGAKGIVMDYQFKIFNYPRLLAQLVPSMSSAPHGQPLKSSELPDLSFAIVATEEKLPGCYRLQDIMSVCDEKLLGAVEDRIDSGDPYVIIYSSGTSGFPKAAVLSHFAICNNSYHISKRAGVLNENYNICTQIPIFHIYGLTSGFIMPLSNGQTVVVAGGVYSRDMTMDALSTYRIHCINGTPTMHFDVCNELKKLLPKSQKYQEACKNLVVLGCSGAYLSQEIIDLGSEVFPNSNIVNAYGSTELSIGFMTWPHDTIEKKKATVGHVIEHVEVKIVDKDGMMVRFGCPGEAWFRSRFAMIKYWGDEEKTKEIITESGWMKSGDVMILHEDGYASVEGRVKDVIIRGGENIFPIEVENFINQHPEIISAQVYGVSDKRLGEEVAASIILQPSSTLTESSLREYCKGNISHFKIPKNIRFVSEFPLTPTRKVKKYVLREIHEKELKEK